MEKSSAKSAAAAAAIPTIIDEDKSATAGARRRRRYILRCCSCGGAFLFFAAILALTLIFTVFRVRGPVFRLNSSAVKLDLINGTKLPRPGSNATIDADVSVKNRNFVSFRYPRSTSEILYRGAMIGEARVPAGNMPARRTTRMNVTVDIIMDRVLAHPDFGSDVKSGRVSMGWYKRVGGRAKFLIIKKHVMLTMNCTATVNVTTQAMAECKCKQKLKLFN